MNCLTKRNAKYQQLFCVSNRKRWLQFKYIDQRSQQQKSFAFYYKVFLRIREKSEVNNFCEWNYRRQTKNEHKNRNIVRTFSSHSLRRIESVNRVFGVWFFNVCICALSSKSSFLCALFPRIFHSAPFRKHQQHNENVIVLLLQLLVLVLLVVVLLLCCDALSLDIQPPKTASWTIAHRFM